MDIAHHQSVVSIEPSVGSINGGTSVLLRVSQFRASDDARCYFGRLDERECRRRHDVIVYGTHVWKTKESASLGGPTTADEIEVTTGPSFRIEKALPSTRWSRLLSEVGGLSEAVRSWIPTRRFCEMRRGRRFSTGRSSRATAW